MYIEIGAARLLPLQSMVMILPVMEENDWRMRVQHVCDMLWRFGRREIEIDGVWNASVVPMLAWIAEKFSDVYSFVKAYPIPFHITAWSIFFGPIIILVPLLLLLELLILVLLYLSFLSHGIYLGPMENRFHGLKEYFMDSRESLFSTVEGWTSVFNTWTSKYPPLLMFRLLCAALGLFTLIGIWTQWKFGVS